MGHMKDLLITVYGGGDDAVEAAKKLTAVAEWIPVSERLPDVGCRVLAFVRCNNHEHPHAVGAASGSLTGSTKTLNNPPTGCRCPSRPTPETDSASSGSGCTARTGPGRRGRVFRGYCLTGNYREIPCRAGGDATWKGRNTPASTRRPAQ
jgi:hypothetical protein